MQAFLQPEVRDWWVQRIMGPIEHVFIKRKISPNAITITGLFFCFFCALLFATGHLLSAGWIILFTGSLDFLDGRVARATNQVTEQGSFLDSVADRYQDFMLFGGLCIFYRESWVFYFLLLALGGTLLVSYVRAKADTMGVDLREIGAMQRPERMFSLGFGSIVSSALQVSLMPFWGKGNPPPQHVLILVIIGLAISTNWTAIRRIRYTMQILKTKERV